MNPQETNIYDKLPEENEIVEKYKPKFIARGGDHLVYSVEGHPNVVIKASSFSIKDILFDNFDKGLKLDSISDSQATQLQDEIAEKTKQSYVVKGHFGSEHTVSEKRYLIKVPISKEILDEIFKDDWKGRQAPTGSENLAEVWAKVIVQEHIPEIADSGHLGLYFGGFLEERKFNRKEYDVLNNCLVKLDPLSDIGLENFLKLQDNTETHAIADILRLAETDGDLRETLIELIYKIISYTEMTGNILALAGEDNIILFKKDDKWNYLLVDALPIHDEPVFRVAKDAIHRAINGEVISKHEKTLIMKTLNFVRTVNGIAMSLGLQERLHLIDSEDQNKKIDFTEIIKD